MRAKKIFSFILIICFVLTSFFLGYGFSVKDNPLFQKALSYYKDEDYEEALVIFQKLYKQNPSTLVSFYLGLVWKQIGEYDKAKKFFLEAID